LSASTARLAAPPQRPVLAVFDLDGTLTRGDTLFAFLRFACGAPRFLLCLLLAVPALAAGALGLLARARAKEAVLCVFLRGMPRFELALRGNAFARERLPRMLRPEAMEKLAWHRSCGHVCVLLSASPDVYVEPFGHAAGFDDVLATRLQYDAAGTATGRIEGENCRGEAKVRRLVERFGPLEGLSLHGYGDSPADRHFLGRCAEAHYRPFRDGDPRLRPLALLRLMRPHQWVKNAFVFVGLLFGHAWHVPALAAAAVLAAVAFSLASSAIYIVNDYADRERDRLHPKKRHRALASGAVRAGPARVRAALLAVASACIAFAAGKAVLAIVAAYAAMNLAYSFSLKNVVILDVFLIAAGFILRILAGTLGIGVLPSQWLLVCSLLLTLFLGFTKRRSELLVLSSELIGHRRALAQYNPALLDTLIGVCACGAIMSYSLYAMSPETARLHGTAELVYTIPFVVYGLFRYLYLLHARHEGSDASRELARDPHMLVAVLAWCAATLWLIS
jgi:HAD superfamily hydrolase (TIGR01490 family)